MQVAEIRKSVLQDIVFMSYVGMRPVIIHGGGPKITQRMMACGHTPQFVNGLRVTDAETIRIIKQVFLEIRREIVAEINALGGKAIGLPTRDQRIISVQRHRSFKKIGFVGQITQVNGAYLQELLRQWYIPIISPIGYDEKGQVYNLNGDSVSEEVAKSVKAQKLVLLTNVPGILTDVKNEDSRISHINTRDIRNLIESKVISGGMIPKVRAAMSALAGKVKKVHIVDARVRHSLLLEIFTDSGVGTEIVK